ncbi:MAG: tetratricopeptide repeat protein [Meiothermus sp.]|uniref:tetratricopeptide repeat protein n=1 Tax=Meiothermus sp. TaxID=1955249 RepID=UPI002600D2D2|nr:tetratricopeptide repeat protein [Meiothermus sp.]MDW8217549.1 tetratricopeptide repeat protein [Acidobacteriota bacterium]MCS7057428.1 tetratricopeptide repeat protein [Meiothermus sp.]MCS7193536.1 tetratricopeptide repeat protein [Meiothermus sp.]MCX7739977.1 tetratricopeptide repeat protein [Meiothermus sp.]MDW8091617.1 tetratricopeptide repeat protein [Meiothermus sp.]
MRFWFLVTALALGGALAQQAPAQPTSRPQNQASLCALLYDAGRPEAALGACERAVKDAPTPENLYLLARVQTELGRFTAAVENLRRAITLNSGFTQAYVALAQTYVRQYLLSENRDASKGLLDQALAVLREAERVNPRYAPIYATRGTVLVYQNRLDQAVESLQRSLSLKDEPVVRALLADVYVRQGKWEEALKNYDEAVKAAPKNAALRVRYGSLLLLRGNLDLAIEHLDQAVVLSPGNAEAWLRRGDAYYEKKDWQQAGVSYQQAVALSPVRYPDAYVGLGQVYMELRDYQKARFNFTKAVALEQNNPVYRYWLCRANELLGDKEGARVQCEQALKLRPDYREAQEVLSRLR